MQERTKAFVPLPKEADEQRKALEVLKYRLRSMGGLFREGCVPPSTLSARRIP